MSAGAARASAIDAALLGIAWGAAVLGGNLAAIAAGGLLAAVVFARGALQRDLTLAAIAAAAGLGLDTALIWAGVLDFHGAPIAPPWSVVLWACAGLSANHALAGLLGRPWRAAAFAALGCQIACVAAAAAGDLRVPAPWLLAGVAAGWAVVFGALLGWIAPFFNRQFEEVV